MKHILFSAVCSWSLYIFCGCSSHRVCDCMSTIQVDLSHLQEHLNLSSFIKDVNAIKLELPEPYFFGRMNGKDAGMYMLFQVIGAIIGSAILYALVTTGGHDGPTATGSNGFGDGEMLQAFIAEVVFTFIFVLVVLGSTDPKKGAGAFAGLAIGLSLVLVHIVCIPITGTSVNPARSIGPALFQGGEALSQLWLFIVAPFVGAAVSALVWNYFGDKNEKK